MSTSGVWGEGGYLSNEQRAPGWLGYIGDDILPSYNPGLLINHYKDHF